MPTRRTGGGTLINGSLSADAVVVTSVWHGSALLSGTSDTSADGFTLASSVELVANDILEDAPEISSPVVGHNEAAILSRRVIDEGLLRLFIEADTIYICSSYPGTFIQAEDLAVAFKSFGATQCFIQIHPGVNGRAIVTTPITDGVFIHDGIASHWAAVDTSSNRLLITHPLDAPVAGTASTQFTLPSFEITFTGQ